MRWRVLIWVVLSSTLGVAVLWWSSHRRASLRLPKSILASAEPGILFARHPRQITDPVPVSPPLSHHRYQLRNTTKSLDQLIVDPKAILLENALFDTTAPLDLPTPESLRAQSNPGSYIVQSRAGFGDSFRATLSRFGATIVAYIPNNAYLVRAQSATAGELASDPSVGAVIPYAPYYKIKSSLLGLILSADDQGAEPIDVKVLLFEAEQSETIDKLNANGIGVLARSGSPFGIVAHVRCPVSSLTWIAQCSGVQELERSHLRIRATDLTRVRMGVASDSQVPLNYLDLTGSNVLVNVNDEGVDSNHPDLAGRVFNDFPAGGLDTNGHGTHVAGIIAGSGSRSNTISNAPGSIIPPAAGQFRGMAPAASIFSIALTSDTSGPADDTYLQRTAASNQALISNNSWHYADDSDYDLGAASFDAAVRDALPATPGSQPLLCVFAAGNVGGGAGDGTGGIADTIQSPGTAKNVITVGAIELPRFITNQTWVCVSNGATVICQTNSPWLPLTDSSNQVASFSSRGNVAPGIEGSSGRFKPDVVAPGTFLISTRSATWDQSAYYSDSNNFLNIAPGGNAPQVLSNLNNGLTPSYRFESGTSLGAAAVSGTLALMEEFFERYWSRTNSPALMKALLINGARSLGGGFQASASTGTNTQGWGLVQLPNSVPAALTNLSATRYPMWFSDQNPLSALATGQQVTRFVSVSSGAQSLPLRVTLTWTDPPGNPVAGLKLVNDLDLIVTNLQTGEVFWGNDIPAGTHFNSPWQPGTLPRPDRVNNVENVYLPPNLGTNYSVTVLARRVGVNAVAEHPNGVVQDYALVISSGDGQEADALSVLPGVSVPAATSSVTFLTNTFGSAGDYGTFLLGQRAGAHSRLLGTNIIAVPGSTNAMISVGTPEQWHFYVFTNDTSFTNAVFLTFLSQPLGLRPGEISPTAGAGLLSLPSADIDLYVSKDPQLTNLDAAVLAAADVSLARGGSETIIYSNAVPGVYYLGVKCESSQGAEYGIVADVSLQPFAVADQMGNEVLRGFPAGAISSAGTPAEPAQNLVFFVTPDDVPIRRVIVTNIVDFALPSDWQATLIHDASSVTLHHYSTNSSPGIQTLVYDDSLEGDIPSSPSDGPGSLRLFSGRDAAGQWIETFTTTNQPGTNHGASILIERQQDLAGGTTDTLPPGMCRQDFVTVPPQSTNLTVSAGLSIGTGPISISVYPRDACPSNCATPITLGTTGGAVTVDQFAQPPLNPGLYVVQTCNLGPDAADVTLQASIVPGLTESIPVVYSSSAPTLIPDDATWAATLSVTNTDPIVSVEVGVRIEHPRVSDLVLSLIGPDGTRVLLDDGRGGTSTEGLGGKLVVTNTTPVSFSGGPEAVTNVFETGETAGNIQISYDFFSLPDEMRVYYESQLRYDSGLVSSRGVTNISYGPGASTAFAVVMNQGGNPEPNTAWFYSVTSTRLENEYLTFTENPNLTVTPIKFAAPPLTNETVAPASLSSRSGIFYLPEETLGRFAGKSPLGQWRLEIQDARAGATNPPPTLLSWQLALSLGASLATPVPLSPNSPFTNLLGPSRIQWYEVDVPDWISFVTNSLFSASAPVNLLFNPATPPTGTNAGDLVLAFGSTAGTWVLRSNSLPALVPGSHYFLGLQNTNPAAVSLAFGVEMDIQNLPTLTPATPYPGTNFGPLGSADYYRYVVSTNAVRVQFEVNSPTSDVLLAARKGPPLPSQANHDFLSSNPGTNDQVIVIYDYSHPVALSPGEWFLAVINLTGAPAAYSILATEYSAYGTNILVSESSSSSNELCLSWNSLPGVHYFVEGKADLDDDKWTSLSTTITASDVSSMFCLALPSPFRYFRVSEGLAMTPARPLISSIGPGTNGTLLQWNARTNLVFSVQWNDSLNPGSWRSVPGSVASTNGTFLFFDDGSQTGGIDRQRFYRLQQRP